MGTAENVQTEEKPKRGRPLQFSPAMCDLLDTLQGSNTIQEIARHLKIERQTVYQWMERFKGFSDAVVRARERADDGMVSATYASGLNGDSKAQVFWLKNRRPGEWRDKIEHEVKGEPISFNFVFPSTDRSEQVTAGQRQVEGAIDVKPVNQTPDSDEVEHVSD